MMTKPHIYFKHGMWWCRVHADELYTGDTPVAAWAKYLMWRTHP